MVDRELQVCDATFTNNYAPSNISLEVSEPSAVAAEAEDVKMSKYANLYTFTFFILVAVETCGVIGPKTMTSIRELGRCLTSATEDQHAFSVHAPEDLSSHSERECWLGFGLSGTADWTNGYLIFFK